MHHRNLIVFGATGSVGKQTVEQTLAAGHRVTAFTRTPAKMTLQNPGLNVVAGDALDSELVSNAIAGHDAVLCAIGAGRHGYVREAVTRNIVNGMQAENVKRLICQTTLGAGDSYNNLNFFWKYIMFGTILRPVLIDHNKQEQAIVESNLDWTIVRPAAFTDGPVTKATNRVSRPWQRI